MTTLSGVSFGTMYFWNRVLLRMTLVKSHAGFTVTGNSPAGAAVKLGVLLSLNVPDAPPAVGSEDVIINLCALYLCSVTVAPASGFPSSAALPVTAYAGARFVGSLVHRCPVPPGRRAGCRRASGLATTAILLHRHPCHLIELAVLTRDLARASGRQLVAVHAVANVLLVVMPVASEHVYFRPPSTLLDRPPIRSSPDPHPTPAGGRTRTSPYFCSWHRVSSSHTLCCSLSIMPSTSERFSQ